MPPSPHNTEIFASNSFSAADGHAGPAKALVREKGRGALDAFSSK
jgi:hypothetical protein